MRSERLVALLFTLQSKRSTTVAALAGALGVSARTMHRDIAALQATGVPISTVPGRHGGVRLLDGWRTRLDGLTTKEAVAMFAMGAPTALAELGLGTAVTAAHAKVLATLPPAVRDQAQHMAQRFHLDAPGWFRRAEEAEHLVAVARAVWEQRQLRVGYRRADEVVERVLEPLGLVLKAGVWYLVARVGDAIRTYRVGRIAVTDELDTRFTRPDDFDLRRWWERSSAQFERSLPELPVRVRLSRRGVAALPAAIGADLAVTALEQAGVPGPDGWTEATLQLERPDIAAGQLLALGPEVEVIEPAAVRAAFAEAARRMADRHR